MRVECEREDRTVEWQLFQCRVLAPILGSAQPPPYEQLIARFGLQSPTQLSNLVTTAKRRYHRHLQSILEDYARSEDDIEEEIKELRAILARGRTIGPDSVYDGSRTDLSEVGISATNIEGSDPELLAKMMDLTPGSERVWHPEELGAVLEHQLRAPLGFDLGNVDQNTRSKLGSLAESEGLLLKSHADLLFHPHPPVELLRMTKDFAKALSIHPGGPLPREVALVIYYASVVVALLRCRARISQQPDALLRDGLSSLVDQTWIGDPLRSLLQEGLDRLHQLEDEHP